MSEVNYFRTVFYAYLILFTGHLLQLFFRIPGKLLPLAELAFILFMTGFEWIRANRIFRALIIGSVILILSGIFLIFQHLPSSGLIYASGILLLVFSILISAISTSEKKTVSVLTLLFPVLLLCATIMISYSYPIKSILFFVNFLTLLIGIIAIGTMKKSK